MVRIWPHRPQHWLLASGTGAHPTAELAFELMEGENSGNIDGNNNP